MKKPIRVIVARLGMDAHWRGSIVVARTLRDAGMDVVYLGNQNSEAIAETAVQEAADVVGLSTLSGNHRIVASPKELLRSRFAQPNLPVIVWCRPYCLAAPQEKETPP